MSKNFDSSSEAYPRVLVVAMGRINAADSASNGLLLRNLFGDFPRNKVAQIFSGANNGDSGFFGSYYELGAAERRMGAFFVRQKRSLGRVAGNEKMPGVDSFPSSANLGLAGHAARAIAGLVRKPSRFLVESGLYEVIFRIRLSDDLQDWVQSFAPDIILAQGYNLSFCDLPLMLARRFGIPVAYYASDDWPAYLYRQSGKLTAVSAPYMRRLVESRSRCLLSNADVPIAFNELMAAEYENRYGQPFATLMHCDDPARFTDAPVIRTQPDGVISVIATGSFDDSRWPMLRDLAIACENLSQSGLEVRITVLATHLAEEGKRCLKSYSNLTVQSDPGHALLPSYLKGADILFLAETFDAAVAAGYTYSISTKAHLFMFSGRPILVYGHEACGLTRYVRKHGWAWVLSERSIARLESVIREMVCDVARRELKLETARLVASENHDSRAVRRRFLDLMESGARRGNVRAS
jgi:hypothetical protein